MEYIRLPIQEKPSICTYTHQAFKHAILESDYYLSDIKCEMDIREGITDAWKIEEERAKAEIEGSKLRVRVEKYEGDGLITASRRCEQEDELVVQVLYQQFTHPDALIDFSIWSGEWEDSSKGEHNLYKLGMVRKKGIFISVNGEIKHGRRNDFGIERYPLGIKISKVGNKVLAYTSGDCVSWDLLCEQEIEIGLSDELRIGFRVIPLENQYYNWLFMNYLNLSFNPNSTMVRLDYYNMPLRDYTDNYLHAFLRYSRYSKEEILDTYRDIHEFVRHTLSHQKYVWLMLDEYYMPCRFAYGKQEYFHGNLVYGFDDVKGVYHVLGYREKVVADELAYEDFEKAVKTSLALNEVTTVCYKPNVYPVTFQKRYFVQAIKNYLEGRNISYDTANILPPQEGVFWGIDVYKQLMANDQNTMIVLKDARVIYILWEHNEIIRQCLEYLIAKGYIVDHENELMDEIKQIIFWCEKLKLTVIEINVISKKKKIPLSEGIDRIRKIIYSIYTKEIGFYSKLYYLLKQD